MQSEAIAQTLSEIVAGRMSPSIPDDGDSIVTRRFPVTQRSSKGKTKIRAIDDFKESGVNSPCSIDGRVKMGSIQNLLDLSSPLDSSS